MNLSKKKSLASRTFGISKSRIVFVPSRLDEIKEAITKQDIKDLFEHGAILMKEKSGRKKKKVGRKKKTSGNIRKKVRQKKRKYVIAVRKQRKYVQYLKDKEQISREKAREVRNQIRNRKFRNLATLKDYLKDIIVIKKQKPKNENTEKKKKRK